MLAACAAVALSGCATEYERVYGTIFTPRADGFSYLAYADATFPLDGAGEEKRLQWLDKYVKSSNLCPRGYTIAARIVTTKVDGPLGKLYNVTYDGHCKS